MSKPTVEGASGAFCPGVPSNQAQDFKKESDFFRQLGSIFRQKRKLVHNWWRDGDDVLVAWNVSMGYVAALSRPCETMHC